jgi:outer membrane lipoprotein carrier protein
MQNDNTRCGRTLAITVAAVLLLGSSAAHAAMNSWMNFSAHGVYQSFQAAVAQTVAPAQVAQANEAAEEGEQASTSATAALDEIVSSVQSYYDSVDDYVADFEQEYTSAAMGETRTSEGRVFFKKPGMMRWDYATPTERYLISDGSQLWIYEPEYGQYFTESLQESQLPAALRFLMGDGDLRDNFDISLEESGEDTATLGLDPKVQNSQYARLKFVVDRQSGAVKETLIYDAVGNENRLIFENTQKNQGLPDSGFQFEPPEGAVQVEAP